MPTTRRTFVLSMICAPAILSARTGARADSRGGTLRIAMSVGTEQLDPHKGGIAGDYVHNNLVFNGLTRMSEQLKVEPDLASSWTTSDDLKTWVFQLRPNVKFHNGRVLTGDDVVGTIKRILDPATTSRSRTNMAIIDTVRAIDGNKVEFKLKIAYAGFADLMTDRQLKIVPMEAVDQLSTHPIGTGPFKFVSHVPGDREIFERFDGYFEEGFPKLDRVEMRAIPESSVQLAALASGEVDILYDLLPESVKDLKSSGTVNVDSVPTGSWDAAIMNNQTAPFNDPRVRLAFNLAIDKRDVIDFTLFGLGSPTHSPIAANHPFFAGDIGFNKPDIEAARKLLTEAGFPGGITIPLTVPSDQPASERLGVTLQQLAMPAGFNLTVERVPYIRFLADYAAKAPLVIDGYYSRPSVDTSTYPFFHSTGATNDFTWHYSNPIVDKILTDARSESHVENQKALYIDFQKELVKNPACFMPYNKIFSCAYGKNIKNLKIHPMQWFDLRTVELG